MQKLRLNGRLQSLGEVSQSAAGLEIISDRFLNHTSQFRNRTISAAEWSRTGQIQPNSHTTMHTSP
jgi:hypothetical protein